MKTKFELIKTTFENRYLFKRDITGTVIFWKACVTKSFDSAEIGSFHGIVHQTLKAFFNDIPKSITKVCEGKNIGKSNETSFYEQAYLELQSDYKKHLKKGYKEYDVLNAAITDKSPNLYELILRTVDVVNTDINSNLQPMLYKKFYDSKRIYPYYGNYKYNGVRNMNLKKLSTDLFDYDPVEMLSKGGEPFYANHLKESMRKIIDYIEDKYGVVCILDGELYIPYTPVTTISGAAKNINNPLNKQLQYIIYDIAIAGYSQKERLDIIKDVKNHFKLDGASNKYLTPKVYIAPYFIINNEEAAMQFLEHSLSLGYEGAIFRPIETEYQFGKRPSVNKKLKKFEDSEFEILEVVEYGDRNSKVGYGVKFICKNDINDLSFEVTVGGNDGTNAKTFTFEDKLRIAMNPDNYIGKLATVKFYERTKNDLPFHHNAINVRDKDV